MSDIRDQYVTGPEGGYLVPEEFVEALLEARDECGIFPYRPTIWQRLYRCGQWLWGLLHRS